LEIDGKNKARIQEREKVSSTCAKTSETRKDRDREVVLEAVKQNGYSIDHADKILKRDILQILLLI